ncbi:MAG: ABC transporter permease [Acidobacteriota bacterium]
MTAKDLFKDGLWGLRVLAKKPAFLTIVLLTLAVSIGASTAIFSVVNALLLRPLPYKEADRLVMIWQTSEERLRRFGKDELPVSYGDFNDLKENNQSFEQIAGLDTWFASLSGVENPERLYGARVSPEFFSLMRAMPLLGRTFSPEGTSPDADLEVLLSYGFFQRQFGGAPTIVGQKLTLNGYAFTVVGVLPQDFRFTEASNLPSSFKFAERTDIYVPLVIGDRKSNRNFHNLAVVARLKPDVNISQARSEVQSFAAQSAQQYPDTNKAYGMKVVALSDQVSGDLKAVLLTIWAATGFVLLIACANLAVLLLARSTTRQKELALRQALGASRAKILYQLLAESVCLSLLGGVIGILIAYFGTSLLIALAPYHVLQNIPVTIDLRVLGFTLGVSVLTGLLFGILPSLQGIKPDLTEELKEGAYGTPRRSRRILQSLVVVEIALALVLLVGAGLSIKSFIYLLRIDPGFDPSRAMTMDVYLHFARYREQPQMVNFFRQAVERIKEIPGVESVGMNYALPLSGVNPSNRFEIEGRPPLETGQAQSANLGIINPDYFRALGIPLKQGRYFTEQDKADSQPVAIIDERMTRQFFPDEDPLNKRIAIAGNQMLTIIGVVGSISHALFEETPRPYVYVPFEQRCYSFTSFAIRSRAADPTGLIAAVRQEMKALDKDLPISNIRTLENAYSQAIAPRRYSMTLLILFASIALFLTEIGIYGVMNYAARQRRQEIGIRMALGARSGDIFRLFIRQGMTLTIIGIAAGLALSAALARLMTSLVYGIGTRDLITFSSVSVLAAVITFLACYLPARSAARVNPTDVLRAE